MSKQIYNEAGKLVAIEYDEDNKYYPPYTLGNYYPMLTCMAPMSQPLPSYLNKPSKPKKSCKSCAARDYKFEDGEWICNYCGNVYE